MCTTEEYKDKCPSSENQQGFFKKLEETDPLEEAEKGEAKGNVKKMKKAFKELDA